jgi:hypothetical protein
MIVLLITASCGYALERIPQPHHANCVAARRSERKTCRWKEQNKLAACDEVFHVAYVSELKFLKFPAVALLKPSAGIARA